MHPVSNYWDHAVSMENVVVFTLLWVHIEINHVGQDLEVTLGLHDSSHHSESETELTILHRHPGYYGVVS